MSHTDTADFDRMQAALRREAWAGELRVNVVRVVALIVFYARHLIEYFTSDAGSIARGPYHTHATAIVVTWALAAFALHYLLTKRFFPDWLPYVSVAVDAAMIAGLCCASRDGRTPLVMLLFVLIGTSPLRLSLRLVYFTTAAAVIAYLAQLMYYAWVFVGYQKYYATPELRVPRSLEAFVVLSLIASGFIAGQCVRQVRRLIQARDGWNSDTGGAT